MIRALRRSLREVRMTRTALNRKIREVDIVRELLQQKLRRLRDLTRAAQEMPGEREFPLRLVTRRAKEG
jgi:hypothetical protein